ncbi:hypothetical protein [Litoribaculum gwangyangense]|uniref:hypothetical protein n=1 Tax=Litoribaculum gwangyangense TaxID=1130722 RepID=UPI0031E63FD9
MDKQHNLRSIGGLKIYIIALVWCGVTVFLPLIETDYAIDYDVIIVAVQRFLYVVVLMLPFEIRDLRYDSLKLATIPQKIGVNQTKIFGSLLLIIFFFLEFFKDQTGVDAISILFLLTLITFLFLLFSKMERGKTYSAFWVEALPILWLILALVIN